MNTNETDYDKQASAFLIKHGIRFNAKLTDTKKPAWSDGDKDCGHHYQVTLSKAGKRITFDFWSSIADKRAGIQTVTPYSVLACISSDTQTPDTFAEFCSEMGMDQDSRKAYTTWKICAAFSKKLNGFFTKSEIEDLAEIQ